MGGKALNKYGVFTERKDTNEFLKLGEAIRETISYGFLKMHSLLVETTVITCYRTKPNHGDLDLLVKITPEVIKANIDYRKFIDLMFLPKAIHSNGGVYSFDYQNFQINFIPIKEESWNIAQAYGFFDPLGNIMGKTFHKFGLSYGWEGLFYKYRNSHGTNSANILLTNDAKKIFAFGGYDYDRYLKGFDTLEEIFRFCIESKYFDAEMFQIENLKSLDKKRNRKRGSYHLFLNYIKENGIKTKFIFDSNKDNYIETVNLCFPEANLANKLNDLQLNDEFNQAMAKKFNGNIIMEWLPELNGKELGQAIGKFKTALGDDYNNVIVNSKIDDIRDLFLKIHKSLAYIKNNN